MSTPRRQKQAAAEFTNMGKTNPLRALTMAELNERMVETYEQMEALGLESQDIRHKFDTDIKDIQERIHLVTSVLDSLKNEKEIRKRTASTEGV